MRKLLGIGCCILFVMAIACSKEDGPGHPIDPTWGIIEGKWSFNALVDLNVPLDALGNHSYVDTLIFSKDSSYFILKNKDTVDRGTYSLGHGEIINGFGKVQSFDSILYKTNSLAQTAFYPSTIYFRVQKDTLFYSTGYYKDSALHKGYMTFLKFK